MRQIICGNTKRSVRAPARNASNHLWKKGDTSLRVAAAPMRVYIVRGVVVVASEACGVSVGRVCVLRRVSYDVYAL